MTGICLLGGVAEFAAAGPGLNGLLALPAVQALVVAAEAGERAELERLKHLCARHDVAFLVADDPALAADLGADGVQIAWEAAAYRAARARLGAERQIGCLAGLTRQAAMEAGEAGADYVGLGDPAGPMDFARLLELTEWWAEIVEVPCVAFGAADPDQARRLAAAGADFVALAAALWRGMSADEVASLAAAGRAP